MTRVLTLVLLCALVLFATPSKAPAQFGPGSPYVPVIVPSFNPFFYVPQYRYQYGAQFNFNVLGGSFRYNSYRAGVSVTNPYAAYAQSLYQIRPPYGAGSSSMSGGNLRPDFLEAAQRNMMRAQREAGMPGGRVGGAGPAFPGIGPGGGIQPQPGVELPKELLNALATKDFDLIAKGVPLNEILKEVIRVEATGAKGPSAFVSPLQLDDIRFSGGPSADLLNLARQRTLSFPAAFDAPATAALRADLARDFAAVAASVRAGKVPDAAKLALLEATFKRFQTAAEPVIKKQPAERAAAATAFLKQLANAIQTAKGGDATGLIDPQWAAEGLTIGELVKYMTKHKFVFAPAPAGRDDTYAALHRNLATYLFVLTQPKK